MVFWVVMACGVVGRNQHFGGTHCLHLQMCMFLQNIGIYLQIHTALQPGRPLGLLYCCENDKSQSIYFYFIVL
jgi:hypothetical protein